MNIEHPHHQPRHRISGKGEPLGDFAFEIEITNPMFTVEGVRDALLDGDLYLHLGDTKLYDEDGTVIGTVEWISDLTDFGVFEVSVLRHGNGDTQ
jgi:hypothetical protein